MRVLLATLLLAVLGLPFVAALAAAAPGGRASLPACCRRGGAHHCGMDAAAAVAERSGAGLHFWAPATECPYRTGALALGGWPVVLGAGAAQKVFAGLVGQPAVVAQTESKLRIARARSRQKRGPPGTSLS